MTGMCLWTVRELGPCFREDSRLPVACFKDGGEGDERERARLATGLLVRERCVIFFPSFFRVMSRNGDSAMWLRLLVFVERLRPNILLPF